MIFLAQRFAHPVLAEGVETMEHASVLREMGCNLVQGFGIARPMPAADTLAWARQWRGQAQRQGAGRLSPSLTGGEGI